MSGGFHFARKEIGDLQFSTLLRYFKNRQTKRNWIFPIDTMVFAMNPEYRRERRPPKKEIGDFSFSALIEQFNDETGRTPNRAFPIDVTPFRKTKAERMGFRI